MLMVMNTLKGISLVLKIFIIAGILTFLSDSIAFSQNKSVSDSLNTSSVLSFEIDHTKQGIEKSKDSFYRTDSIFSFRSPNGYFPSLIHNIGEQVAAPFHFRGKQLLYTGVAAGITTALFFADEDIDAWARTQKQNHRWVNASSPFISEFGSNYGLYVVFAHGLVSAAFKNEKGVQTSLLATQAFVTSGIWTQIIKQLTGRERPKASYIFSHIEGGRWHGIFSKYLEVSPDDRSKMSYDAFPSGHTATAFSIATVFATQYSDIKAVPILCYSAATAVGISRLTEHEHWASDVFAGALIGYLSGKQVVQNFRKTHPNSRNPYLPEKKNLREIAFIQNGNQIGLSIIW
jgi:membrane-associated phospholipid phosphatase